MPIRTLEYLKQVAPNDFLRDFIDTAYHWREQPVAVKRRPTGRIETTTEVEVSPEPLPPSATAPVYWNGVLERPRVLVDIGEQIGDAGSGALTRNDGRWSLIDYLTQDEGDVRYSARLHAPSHHWDGNDPLTGQQIAELRIEDRPTWAAVRLDPDAPTPPTRRTGDMYWDVDNHCPSFVLEGSDTVWQGPMEDLLYGQNDSGVPHLNGAVGYINGSQGQRPTIDISRADDRTKSLAVVFATEAEIASNNSGYYTSRGFVRDVNTNGMAQGARLWLQPTGGYGTGKPSVGANVRNVMLGHVVNSHSVTGSLFADITPYPFIDELSGVSIVSPTAGQVLAFNGTIWENVTIGSGGAPIENHNDLSGRTVENCHNAMAITDFYALTTGQLTKRDGSGMVAAIPNTDYLAVNNPTYTGTLAGPRATLTEFGKFQSLVGNTAVAAIYGTGVTPSTTNYALRFNDSGTGAILNASTAVSLAIGATSKVYVTTDAVDLGSGVALKMAATTVIDSSRNITGISLKATGLASAAVRPATIGTDGLLGAQDPAVFLGTIGAAPSSHTHPYLPINNPSFTGNLSGTGNLVLGTGAAYLSSSIVWRTSSGVQYFSTMGSSVDWILRSLEDNGAIRDYPLVVDRAVSGMIRLGYSGGVRPITLGGEVTNPHLAGIGIRPMVVGATGIYQSQDAATFRGTISAAAAVHDHASITGSAAKLTTPRSIGMTGDASWSVSFDGSANVSGAMTLASIITAGGPVGSPTKTPQFTWDSKGRLTAVDEVTITPAWSSITSKPTTFSGLGVTMLASDIPNHASRHHWDGADPLDGQSIAGLRITSSPTFLDVTAGQFYATSNGLGQNYRVGDDLWIGDIDLANTCRIAGVQNPAIAYIKFGSAGGPTLGFSGTEFTLSSGIVLNGDLSFYNGAAVAYPGSGIGLRPASGIVRLVVDDTLVTANTAFLATSGQFANLVSGFVKSSSSGQLINGSILATDLPNHASRHEYGGSDSLAGQSINGLRTTDSPSFANLSLSQKLKFSGFWMGQETATKFCITNSVLSEQICIEDGVETTINMALHPYESGYELGDDARRWNLRANDVNHDLETLTATNTTPGSLILAIPSTGNGFILVNGASGSTRNYRVPNAPGSGIMKRIVLFSASIDPTGFTRIYPPSSGQLWNGGTQVTTHLEFSSSAGDLKIVMDSDGSNWYI